MANLERIRTVVERIREWEQQPSGIRFDMETWYEEVNPPKDASPNFCGTSVCFAGAAAVVAGMPIYRDDEEVIAGKYTRVILKDGKTESIEGWAVKYLGLDYDQADRIFYSCDVQDSEELLEVIEEVLGEKVFESAVTA